MRLLIKDSLVAHSIHSNPKIIIKSETIYLNKINKNLRVRDMMEKLFISLSLINLMIERLINLILRYKIHQELV